LLDDFPQVILGVSQRHPDACPNKRAGAIMWAIGIAELVSAAPVCLSPVNALSSLVLQGAVCAAEQLYKNELHSFHLSTLRR